MTQLNPQNLDAWLTYLESLHPKTIALGLERVAQVKQQLALQVTFPVIIVAGTNGKGSVCAMLEAMLHAAGYRVGCYTSPHLLSYNERVRMSKQPVSDAELCASFTHIEQARQGVALTYFEFGTLAAMQLFIAHRVEVAILEVGLGGRLDAVNAFDADCAVVTSIDIDHTDYLGDTREQIAFEKAGIFRTAKVAIFGDPVVPQAIETAAQKTGARLWRLGNEFGFKLTVLNDFPIKQTHNHSQGVVNIKEINTSPALTNPSQWDFFAPQQTRNSLPFPALRGNYQLNNASAALAALSALQEKLPVSMEAVRRGLLEVTLTARFQIFPGKPSLILDVAHNPQAARALASNLAALPKQGKTFAVCAMLKDKDIAGVVAALKTQIDVWLLAGLAVPRGATVTELAAVLEAENVLDAQCFTSVSAALHHAYNQAGDNDRIAAFGSFYTVAEVMRSRDLHSS